MKTNLTVKERNEANTRIATICANAETFDDIVKDIKKLDSFHLIDEKGFGAYNSIIFLYCENKFIIQGYPNQLTVSSQMTLNIPFKNSGVRRIETEDFVLFTFNGSRFNEIDWSDFLGEFKAYALNPSTMCCECGASCFWDKDSVCHIFIDKTVLNSRVNMVDETYMFGADSEYNISGTPQYYVYSDNFFKIGYVWNDAEIDGLPLDDIFDSKKIISDNPNYTLRSTKLD